MDCGHSGVVARSLFWERCSTVVAAGSAPHRPAWWNQEARGIASLNAIGSHMAWRAHARGAAWGWGMRMPGDRRRGTPSLKVVVSARPGARWRFVGRSMDGRGVSSAGVCIGVAGRGSQEDEAYVANVLSRSEDAPDGYSSISPAIDNEGLAIDAFTGHRSVEFCKRQCDVAPRCNSFSWHERQGRAWGRARLGVRSASRSLPRALRAPPSTERRASRARCRSHRRGVGRSIGRLVSRRSGHVSSQVCGRSRPTALRAGSEVPFFQN